MLLPPPSVAEIKKVLTLGPHRVYSCSRRCQYFQPAAPKLFVPLPFPGRANSPLFPSIFPPSFVCQCNCTSSRNRKELRQSVKEPVVKASFRQSFSHLSGVTPLSSSSSLASEVMGSAAEDLGSPLRPAGTRVAGDGRLLPPPNNVPSSSSSVLRPISAETGSGIQRRNDEAASEWAPTTEHIKWTHLFP